MERVAVYESGRAEAVFSDGSAVVLHPPIAQRVTFFDSNGARQRLLSSCLPKCSGKTDLRAKILTAAGIRDRFHPHPSCLSDFKRKQRRPGRATQTLWPAITRFQPEADGSVRVASIDGLTQVTLASHSRTYVVEWWRPCRCEAEMRCGEAQIVYEYVRQEQCFAVEPVQLAWVYPVFLALHSQGKEVLSLAAVLEQQLAEGQALDSGYGVSTALPEEPTSSYPSDYSSDSISPAVLMGEPSEGAVALVWARGSTILLQNKDASIDAVLDLPDSASSVRVLLESSLSGRFWKRSACIPDTSEIPELICSEVRAPGRSLAAQLLLLVDEAGTWLRHNAACAKSHALPAHCLPLPGSSCPWVPEMEVEGPARLTIFRSARRSRLFRVLFEDGSRLSFEADSGSCDSLDPSQTFRLVKASGDILVRRFAEPIGAEFEVLVTRALLASLHPETYVPDVADRALRRSTLALAQQLGEGRRGTAFGTSECLVSRSFPYSNSLGVFSQNGGFRADPMIRAYFFRRSF